MTTQPSPVSQAGPITIRDLLEPIGPRDPHTYVASVFRARDRWLLSMKPRQALAMGPLGPIRVEIGSLEVVGIGHILVRCRPFHSSLPCDEPVIFLAEELILTDDPAC